ncbi:MAG: T9SS type A sorting domain-containing protein [Ignavibacteriaceae bacterium]|nr:T9SS type A sorting domain-containing protein [Ignavibacteriaceae bacterium]
MNSFYKLFLPVLLLLFFAGDSFAQTFETGSIGVNVNDYGRLRIGAPTTATRQVDRSSILVSKLLTAVFDYNQDAKNVTPSGNVASPVLSDFEIACSYDNAYSNLPPNILVNQNVYGWNGGGYAISKFQIVNREADAFNATIGMEIIPQVDNVYGGEIVNYIPTTQIVASHKNEWVGYKILSTNIKSMKVINWFDGYGTDSAYYLWLKNVGFDPQFTAGLDGSVIFISQDPVMLQPNMGYDFYIAVSVGANEAEMTANMNLAVAKYQSILPVELSSFTAVSLNNKIQINWETATEINNYGFEIERKAVGENNWTLAGFKKGAGSSTESTKYTFVDESFSQPGVKLQYRLKQIDFNGAFTYFDAVEVELAPVEMMLEQNYPNPFNPTTTISFSLPHKENVSLKVFNTMGEEVASLSNGSMEAGSHNINFNSHNLASGLYFYTLTAGNKTQSKKMLLLK